MTHQNETIPPIKHIIWDSALTLTTIRTGGLMREIGIFRFIGMLCKGFTPLSIRQRIYDILIDQEGHQSINLLAGQEYVRDEKGIILPAFIVDQWLASKLTDTEILNRIDTYVDNWAFKTPIKTTAFENESIKKIMRVMFAAESIARNTRPIKKASRLVQKCTAKYTQYILSNWQKESFEKIYQTPQNRTLFAAFLPEHVISSGSCGLVKPHRSIFEYLLTKNNLTADECLFIDDQEENVLQARACGMHALLLERGNYKKLERQLRALRIL